MGWVYGFIVLNATFNNISVISWRSIPQEHKRLCLLMLNAGKHVLCEKSLTLTTRYTKMLNAVAKEKHLFFMEVKMNIFYDIIY